MNRVGLRDGAPVAQADPARADQAPPEHAERAKGRPNRNAHTQSSLRECLSHTARGKSPSRALARGEDGWSSRISECAPVPNGRRDTIGAGWDARRLTGRTFHVGTIV